MSWAIFAPIISLSILIPAVAIGKSPTAVKTEYLPPTLSGITNVSYPSSVAKVFNAPFSLSVVTYILSFAFSIPYLFSNISLNILKAIAGSVVVPDFEITLIEKSLFPINYIKSRIYLGLMLLPAYKILGVFLFSKL